MTALVGRQDGQSAYKNPSHLSAQTLFQNKHSKGKPMGNRLNYVNPSVNPSVNPEMVMVMVTA